MHSYQHFVLKTVHKFHKTLKTNVYCGERGIRTPGTVNPYVSLANWWFQPLTHLTKTAPL